MKKTFVFAGFVLALSLCLSSCGGNSKDTAQEVNNEMTSTDSKSAYELLREEARRANEMLPMVLEDNIVATSVSYKSGVFQYNYLVPDEVFAITPDFGDASPYSRIRLLV